MRRLGTILIVLLLVPVCVATAVRVRKRASPKCPTTHRQLIAVDSQAELYEAPDAQLEGLFRIFGCAFSDGHPYVLGAKAAYSSMGGGGITKEALAGTIIGYEQSSSRTTAPPVPPVPLLSLVIVRDLHTGKVLHKARSSSRMIVVKPNGSVAWLAQINFQSNEYKIEALDKSGSRVLASGTDIEPGSLALAGSTLYWTQESKPFSATLN